MNLKSCNKASCSVIPDKVVVGVIAGVWGKNGGLKVKPLTNNPKRFSLGNRLIADECVLEIVALKWNKEFVILEFKGFNTGEKSKTLIGSKLEVSSDNIPSLPDGFYYHFQILNLEVWDKNGEHLGVVNDILQTGSNDVYVVKGAIREILIPAIKNVVLEVNLAKGLINVDLPDGLI